MTENTLWSAGYWEQRYALGGTSGAGSFGRLASYKAAMLNTFMTRNDVSDVMDFGCGDGNLLSLLTPPAYLGIDVSPTALARCATRVAGRDNHRFVSFKELPAFETADLAISIDVMFHLVEDAVFIDYLDRLFCAARRFVVIYASNCDSAGGGGHVRHRRFSDRVARRFPEWRLAAHLPNPYGFSPDLPNDTSFADFFIYTQRESPCVIELPSTLQFQMEEPD